MKNRIKIFATLFITLTNLLVYAQRTVTLRQFEVLQQAYRNSPDPVADGLDEGEDITYIKDQNNELNQFLGTWKGTYNSINYEFVFVKRVAYKADPSDEKARDLLKVSVTSKNSAGTVVFTNTNLAEKANGFTGANFLGTTSTYRLNFTGNCYSETGSVFIYLMPDGKMSLSFAILPDVSSNDCPNGYTPVLPLAPNKVILTKQP
jgi:hypothetical protein